MKAPRGTWNTDKNLKEVCVYFAVRKCISEDWLNDREQFLRPQDSWLSDNEFQNDCLAYALFHNQNGVSSTIGKNHWIPFRENEIMAARSFESTFMTDYISGKNAGVAAGGLLLADRPVKRNADRRTLEFSSEAQAVFEAGRSLLKYYHMRSDSLADASLFDIREYLHGRNDNGKMNSKPADAKSVELVRVLRDAVRRLAGRIQPKVYEYGFLKG